MSSDTFAHVNKLYGPSKLVNIVGLMGFYSTAAAELETRLKCRRVRDRRYRHQGASES